jgi:type IV pilus assembly protein PilN
MTAIRANLLPHRQIKRAQQQKTLLAMLAFVALVGVATVILGHFIIAGMKDAQDRRNAFIKSEITKLDAQIKEIAELKKKTEDLLDRKKVVESLQSNRAEVVHMFDELARRLPDGVYLKSLKQNGTTVSLAGYAQSSARVSTLMRNLDASDWFSAPRLIEVKSASVGGLRVHEFNLDVQHSAPQPANPDGAAGKQPGPGAGQTTPAKKAG